MPRNLTAFMPVTEKITIDIVFQKINAWKGLLRRALDYSRIDQENSKKLSQLAWVLNLLSIEKNMPSTCKQQFL